MITLYHDGESAHCIRARIGLALAGVPYRQIAMKPDGDPGTPSIRAMATLGAVPLLVDGRAVVGDSYAILLWLGERFPRLLPARMARARALTWLEASANVVDPPVQRAADLLRRGNKDSREVRDAFADVRLALSRVERAQTGSSHPYVMGRTLTVVDAALFPAFAVLADLAAHHGRAMQLGRAPWWKAWCLRMRARPEIRVALAQPAG